MPGREKQIPTGLEALTSIGKPIHCAATPDAPEGQDELDKIAINHLLDTLAEVALAVANRRIARNQQGEQLTE